MPNYLENFGLEYLHEDEKLFMGILGYAAQEGKPITGYSGHKTFFKALGDIDFYLHAKPTEDGRYETVGLDTHCNGMEIWSMRHTGIDLTPKDASPTDARLFMFKRDSDGSGFVPIHVLNADLLPSLLENDVVEMQMCAFATNICYYAAEEDYESAQPADEDGKHWLLANGTLFPGAFLRNHHPDRAEEEDFSTDDLVLFHATVKQLYPGVFEVGDSKENLFVRCVADTEYGEISFVHSIDQVPEEQRKNLKPGAVISGICVLSGDVAIDRYENGIVRDAEHNLKLVRQVFTKGDAERLRSVLAEDCVYCTVSASEVFVGADEIVAWVNFVHEGRRKEVFVHTAVITEDSEAGLEYPAGSRCLILAYNDAHSYDAIAFVDTDENGNISRILVTKDSGYRFRVDQPPKKPSPFDGMELPESVLEPIFLRAKFHGFLDGNTELDVFVKGMTDYASYEADARRMLDALNAESDPASITVLENIFGYLFAKAIERSVNDRKLPTEQFRLTASYRPSEAFEGEISSTFVEKDHQKLVKCMNRGKQFRKDFAFFIGETDRTQERYTEELLKALVFVQYIGSCYAEKAFPQASETN